VTPVVNGKNSFAVAVVSTRSDGSLYHVSVPLKDIGIQNADSYSASELFGELPDQKLNKGDNIDVLVPPTGENYLFKT